jgi:transketolase
VTTLPAGTSLPEAYGRSLVDLGEKDTEMVVLDTDPAGSSDTELFRHRFPDRFIQPDRARSTLMAAAAELAHGGRTVYVATTARSAAGPAYHTVREAISFPGANVKISATHGGASLPTEEVVPPTFEDIGLMRGLPRMTVVVPADASETRAATFAIHERGGPSYVRLTRENLPPVTDGTFQIGRAGELRAGTDLAIVAVGAMVARALTVAEDLGKVGVSTRVLDFASVKPFDEPALLRAARDTGAILVVEEHSVLTGVGALVASTTSENYPVPVRRAGMPDVFVGPGDPTTLLDRYGLGLERIRDEAWELLRLRGKVQ